MKKSSDTYKNGCKGIFPKSSSWKQVSLLKGIIVILLMSVMVACNDDISTPTFKDGYSTLYSFLEDNEDYSLFKEIVDSAKIDNTSETMESVYSSYNSNTGETRYTLFLPDNMAIEDFLLEKSISMEELTSSAQNCWDLAANHLLNQPINARDFPNGQFSETTVNGEKHTVRYEESAEGVVYFIDERASVLIPDLSANNGIIHVIDHVLIPISYTSCEWLRDNDDYSIFYEALLITGFYDALQSTPTDELLVTMFVESDAVFQDAGVNSIEDLKARISPSDTDYTNETNLLYKFVAYHLLQNRALYITDMVDGRNNYDTYTTYPLAITVDPALSMMDDLSVGIALDQGFIAFDTLVNESGDTTVIDYVSLYEVESNRPTLSGVMHFTNHMLDVDTSLTPAMVVYDFDADPAIKAAKEGEANTPYTFYDEDLELFEFGGDLNQINYRRNDDAAELARSGDYIYFGGIYEISYTTSRILQGSYNLQFRMDATEISGLVDVYFDGRKVGATVNLDAQTAPNTSNPYSVFTVGYVQVEGYEEHVLTLKAVTPGFVKWDYFRFLPLN